MLNLIRDLSNLELSINSRKNCSVNVLFGGLFGL